MQKTGKLLLLNGWTISRWLQLALGIYLLVTAYLEADMLAGATGIFFSAMAIFKFGCLNNKC
ncbi:MAG: hypothetical protein ACJAT1_002452 [Marivirga sp.]|jgi:hypothetical protein